MDVLVDTGLVVEARGLPELRNVASGVVVVQQELGHVANCEESDSARLCACIEGAAGVACVLAARLVNSIFLKQSQDDV